MMRKLAILVLALTAIGARSRIVRRPPPDPVVHYRGDASRSGVYATKGPRTFTSVAWQVSIAPSFSPPVYAKGTLYVPDDGGRIVALDGETGTRRWRTSPLGAFISAPTIAKDAVYVGSESGRVYALSPASGATLWSFAPDNWVVASPLVKDGRMYFGTESGTFYAVDLASHAEVWHVAAGDPIHAPAAYDEGLVVFYAGARLMVVDAATGAERWHRAATAPWFGVAMSGGVVYALSSEGVLALDARSGAQLWLATLPNVRGWSGPSVLNGMVFATTDRNQVAAFDAANGRLLWSKDVADFAFDVLLADAVVYFGTGALQPTSDNVTRRVYALESATGAELWSTTVEGHVRVAVAIGDGKVFVITSKGILYALR